MATLRSRPARDEDFLALELRPLDIEAMTKWGATEAEGREASRRNSLCSFAIERAGRLLALWGYGCNGFGASTAYLWSLASPEAERYPLSFGLASWREVENLAALFPRLEVMCYSPNNVSLKWLRWLGFTEFRRELDFIFLERTR